jgi:hypothetical protein
MKNEQPNIVKATQGGAIYIGLNALAWWAIINLAINI